MNSTVNKISRRDRSVDELVRLSARITAWLEHRRKADSDKQNRYIGRHKTQLEALESVLLTAADRLATDLGKLPEDLPVGEFYDRCRDFDEASVWLERMWEFYRVKFDQRDDSYLGPLLRGADEVVWSCYRSIMSRAAKRNRDLVRRPSPLAFVAPEFSPAALESDSSLRGGLVLRVKFESWDKNIDERVRSLPLPLLQLPPWCVGSPWWLIYVGHEVGHHVLSDLGLLGHFKEGIEAKAKEVDGISEAQAKRWRAWTEEIVADVVSVLLMGTWAVWAVAEVECSTTERMLRHKKDYPAPAVRLALLSHAALRQGFDENEGLRGISIAELAKQQPELAPWFAAVKPVVEFVLGELPDRLGTLASLCDTNRAELEKDVKWWSDQLTREELPNVPPELETARNVAAASLSAWSRAIDESMDATERQKKIKHLAKSTTEMLQKSGPPGTRGADQPSGVRKADGEALARELMASSRRRRESETPE